MKVCSYCHITISESDSVCPRDGQAPIEVQPQPIDSELQNRFDSVAFFGSGSTGDLYTANDSLSQQHGLLKILKPNTSNNAAERMRIKRELAKQTNFSNHVVPVIALGESGEAQAAEKALWLFRQRIEGESLKVCLKREGRLKVSTTVGIAAQIVMGLDMIHRAGLLHRDLKPGHVLLQSHESGLPRVFLLDTGIPARIETKSLFDLVGTAEYLSPEQLAGKLNSFRSDLYALGCVLYEMLVGQPPFIGRDIDAVFKAHQTESPPVPDVELPDPLRTLILSLLAKEPRERPFSAQQVFRSLEPSLPPSPLFKRSTIASRVQAPQPVVTSQPTKTVSGIVSPASVPPPVPPKSRRSMPPPTPISAIKSSVPPPPPPAKVKGSISTRPAAASGSVPPPPPPAKVKGNISTRPAAASGGVPLPPPRIKSSVPPRARTLSSVPPPPVPQGPVAIPRDAPSDDLIPITAGVSSDSVLQADGVTAEEFDVELEDIAAPYADADNAKRSEDAEAIPQAKSEASSPLVEASSAPDTGDGSDHVEETDTARMKGQTLEKVLTVSALGAPEAQSASTPEKSEAIEATYQSNRPSVDFQVESLFDDELPQRASQPSGTAPESYPPSQGSAEIVGVANRELATDTQRTAPVSVLQRFDRRLVVGVAGGLVVSVGLVFALSNWESNSDAPVQLRPVPTATSPKPKDETDRVEAIGTTPIVTVPTTNAVKIEPSEVSQPAETEKQDDADRAPREDDIRQKESLRSRSGMSSAKASSRDSRSGNSASAAKLRTEAREHYAAGRYKSAATAYRKITKMKPSDAGAFAGLGASNLALNRARRAIKAYKTAIKLQPKNSGFHAALARAYASKGDRDRAIRTYQKALKLNPRNRVARVALRQLIAK